MRRILLGLTGSVATVLAPKMVRALQEKYDDVAVIMTSSAKYFVDPEKLLTLGVKVYMDHDEWPGQQFGQMYQKDDPILHIELRKNTSALVVAPISADTLAKMANGICDNLLTSVLRAWDFCRPIIVAPAMNTLMWQHPITKQHIQAVKGWGVAIVNPISKMLACKEMGEGAMAEIDSVMYALKEELAWATPLDECSGIPIKNHPGAFGVVRRHSHHTGIDLYARDGDCVYAVESGRVIAIEAFTGPQDGSPWWNDTDAMLIEGPSGVICYGEIRPHPMIRKGDVVRKRQCIGLVKRVLLEGKERPDIPGHKPNMLHLELYPFGTAECSKSWKLDQPQPDSLLDPTPYLIEATETYQMHSMHGGSKRLEM